MATNVCVKDLENRIEQLENIVALRNDEIKRLKDFRKERGLEHESEIKALKNEIKSLRKQLAGSASPQTVVKKNKEIADYRRDLESLKAQSQELAEVYSKARQNLADMQRSLDTATSNYELSRARADEAEARFGAMKVALKIVVEASRCK